MFGCAYHRTIVERTVFVATIEAIPDQRTAQITGLGVFAHLEMLMWAEDIEW